MGRKKLGFLHRKGGYIRHRAGFVLILVLFAFCACSEETFKGNSKDADGVPAEGEFPLGILYVDVDNTSGVYDGLSWETAFVAIQQGSVAVVDTGGEVWVAEGSYWPPIAMLPGVHLYGGFAGNETERDQRDWTAHPTVISGGTPCVTSADNATLDGFRITAGVPGMTIDSGAPLIRNCLFSGNVACGEPAGPPSMGTSGNGAPGGSATNWALVISGGAPEIENCVFSGNGAAGAPGGNGIGSGWCVAFRVVPAAVRAVAVCTSPFGCRNIYELRIQSKFCFSAPADRTPAVCIVDAVFPALLLCWMPGRSGFGYGTVRGELYLYGQYRRCCERIESPAAIVNSIV